MRNRNRQQLEAALLSVFLASALTLSPVPATAAQHNISDLLKASENVGEQLKSRPTDITLLLQRAALQFALKNYDAALVDLNELIKLEPSQASAHFLRSNTYLSLKQYKLALEDVDKALSLSKENTVDKLFHRANCNYMLGHDQAAISDLDQVLKTPALTAEQKLLSYANRAEIRFRLGLYSECLSDCSNAISIDPRGCGGAAYYWRAESAKALKNPALATAAAAKVKLLGYVDVGRAVVPNNYLVYANMFDPAQKSFHHRIDTKHFSIFYKTDFKADFKPGHKTNTNRSEEWAKLVALFAERFLTRINSDLLKLDWPEPVNVYMMPDKTSQHKFLVEQMNYQQNCTGTILPSRNALVFHTDSGLGTVGHVLFSQIAHNQLPNDDSFSGLIAFFEKIYGYQDKGNSALYWGYQNPWRLKLVAKSLPNLTLANLIKLSQEGKDDSQCEERLLSIFLFQKEKFKHYVELVAANDRKGYGTFLEAAFNKPITQIEPEWHQYLLSVKNNLAKLENTPVSEFALSKVAFDKFVGEHRENFKDLALHASSRGAKAFEIQANLEKDNGTDEKAIEVAPGVLAQGWVRAGDTAQLYEMGVDKTVRHKGTASGYIKTIDKEFTGNGTLMQACLAEKFVGKKLKLTCFTKTKDVTDWAGVWMRVDGQSGHLAFDNMQDRPIKGTTDWTERSVTLDVPPGSSSINFGILLVGAGQVWVDDFSFAVVGESGKASTKRASYINDEPTNLNFDEHKGTK